MLHLSPREHPFAEGSPNQQMRRPCCGRKQRHCHLPSRRRSSRDLSSHGKRKLWVLLFCSGSALLFLLDWLAKGEYFPSEARKDLVGRRQLEPSAYLCPFAGFSSSGFSALAFFGRNRYSGVVGCRNVRTIILFGSGAPFFVCQVAAQKFIFENCFHF